MPFADYDDFDDCVGKNQDKEDPEAYCGKIKGEVEKMTKTKTNGPMRKFCGWGTVAIKDKSGELLPSDDVAKVMPTLMERGAPVTLEHSNAVVGKLDSWEMKKNGDGDDGIYVCGHVFSHYPLDDKVWKMMESGTIGMLSIGGDVEKRTPTCDGDDCYILLGDSKVYEMALVPQGMNQKSNLDYVGVVKMEFHAVPGLHEKVEKTIEPEVSAERCGSCKYLSLHDMSAAPNASANWEDRLYCSSPTGRCVKTEKGMTKARTCGDCEYLGYESSTGETGCNINAHPEFGNDVGEETYACSKFSLAKSMKKRQWVQDYPTRPITGHGPAGTKCGDCDYYNMDMDSGEWLCDVNPDHVVERNTNSCSRFHPRGKGAMIARREPLTLRKAGCPPCPICGGAMSQSQDSFGDTWCSCNRPTCQIDLMLENGKLLDESGQPIRPGQKFSANPPIELGLNKMGIQLPLDGWSDQEKNALLTFAKALRIRGARLAAGALIGESDSNNDLEKLRRKWASIDAGKSMKKEDGCGKCPVCGDEMFRLGYTDRGGTVEDPDGPCVCPGCGHRTESGYRGSDKALRKEARVCRTCVYFDEPGIEELDGECSLHNVSTRGTYECDEWESRRSGKSMGKADRGTDWVTLDDPNTGKRICGACPDCGSKDTATYWRGVAGHHAANRQTIECYCKRCEAKWNVDQEWVYSRDDFHGQSGTRIHSRSGTTWRPSSSRHGKSLEPWPEPVSLRKGKPSCFGDHASVPGCANCEYNEECMFESAFAKMMRKATDEKPDCFGKKFGHVTGCFYCKWASECSGMADLMGDEEKKGLEKMVTKDIYADIGRGFKKCVETYRFRFGATLEEALAKCTEMYEPRMPGKSTRKTANCGPCPKCGSEQTEMGGDPWNYYCQCEQCGHRFDAETLEAKSMRKSKESDIENCIESMMRDFPNMSRADAKKSCEEEWYDAVGYAEDDRSMRRVMKSARPRIQTAEGSASYVLTETEDANGNWNDEWSTKDGYYVVHEGTQHHVYRVSKSLRKYRPDSGEGESPCGDCDECGAPLKLKVQGNRETGGKFWCICPECGMKDEYLVHPGKDWDMWFGKSMRPLHRTVKHYITRKAQANEPRPDAWTMVKSCRHCSEWVEEFVKSGQGSLGEAMAALDKQLENLSKEEKEMTETNEGGAKKGDAKGMSMEALLKMVQEQGAKQEALEKAVAALTTQKQEPPQDGGEGGQDCPEGFSWDADAGKCVPSGPEPGPPDSEKGAKELQEVISAEVTKALQARGIVTTTPRPGLAKGMTNPAVTGKDGEMPSGQDMAAERSRRRFSAPV